jgi:Protein of unknown function (DUF2569)
VLVIFFPIGVTLELLGVWLRARLAPQFQLGLLIVTMVDVAMLALAISAGVLLYRERAIGVRLAQLFFVLRFLIALVVLVQTRAAGSVLAALVSAAWLIYLATSERVRFTYPAQATRISEIFR